MSDPVDGSFLPVQFQDIAPRPETCAGTSFRCFLNVAGIDVELQAEERTLSLLERGSRVKSTGLSDSAGKLEASNGQSRLLSHRAVEIHAG